MSTTRAAGERIRAKHTIQRLRTIIDSIERVIDDTELPRNLPPPDPGDIQAFVHTAVDLGMVLTRLGAYSMEAK